MAILVTKKLCTLPARRRGKVTARPPGPARPALRPAEGRPCWGTCVGARPWAWLLGARVPCSYPSLVIRRNDLDVLDYIYLSFEFENSSNYSEFSPILDAAAALRPIAPAPHRRRKTRVERKFISRGPAMHVCATWHSIRSRGRVRLGSGPAPGQRVGSG